MSTFNGLVAEFPDIRIDFFRKHANAPPPLACFLSHVHSDHLAGLDSLRSPFVYCSAATREILLRLERYPCRINYAQGILEARQQTYRHLGKVLRLKKPLPLETPTIVELQPGHHMQVTLFDANHCPGAVMFLIEGDGKSVLYTGDIRSEPWFVTTLARNPILIEYTCGLKTLDKIYLDTSFISNVPFQTKADGIAELLRKVSRYPNDTVFHIQAWTYGYEEVWIALSKALKSPIHVDDYKMRIYNSLRSRPSEKQSAAEFHIAAGAAALTGHMCGNTPHPGCLTSNQNVRLHSCEKGEMCVEAKRPDVVRIQPIVARLPGGEKLVEAGVGGGGEDLEREAELAFPFQEDLLVLLELISSSDAISEAEQGAIRSILGSMVASGRSLSLNLDASTFREGQSTDLQTALRTLSHRSPSSAQQHTTSNNSTADGLPRVIQFPYSRHSSYPELCHLVKTFKPKDIWPCTVDPEQWVAEDISIKSLFGDCCSGQVFEHDLTMAALAAGPAPVESQAAESERMGLLSRREYSPERDTTSVEVASSPLARPLPRDTSMQQRMVSLLPDSVPLGWQQQASDESQLRDESPCRDTSDSRIDETVTAAQDSIVLARKRRHSELGDAGENQAEACADDSQRTEDSSASAISTRDSLSRREAYCRMLDNATDDGWRPITLLSTDGNHSVADEEL
ncbi:Protein artemis [Tolypocladium paradoxum]|uniref:Protein artemis n=1 Tax=Tolypocladium paradoxum TaxID=94208 RepID=A0A2S4L1D3_9HYPO|nr:Protein artemis [Tolypocladium paradoxum]